MNLGIIRSAGISPVFYMMHGNTINLSTDGMHFNITNFGARPKMNCIDFKRCFLPPGYIFVLN